MDEGETSVSEGDHEAMMMTLSLATMWMELVTSEIDRGKKMRPKE